MCSRIHQLQYIIHVVQFNFNNNSVVLSINYRYIIGKLLVYYQVLQGMAVGQFVLFGVIGVTGG